MAQESEAARSGDVLRKGVLLYLWACGVLDGWVGALWCPGDALHHMFVLSQFSLALFGGHNPHAHCLVVGAAGDQCAILVGPHHADPLPVACEGLHTVADAQNQKNKKKQKGVIMLSEWNNRSRFNRAVIGMSTRVRTQLPPPTFLWFCPSRQKRCDLHWAWWLQTKHCGHVLENRKDKNKISVRYLSNTTWSNNWS